MFRLALLAGALAVAGGAPVRTDDKKDPQAKFEPRSKPGEGQKFLEAFVGDWEVSKTFHPRTGEPAKAKGTCRQTMVQDGRFLQSEFTFETDAGKTTGTGLIGFEPETGKFTSVWIDSRQTRMSFRQSEEKFDGKSIVLTGKALGEGAKGGRRSQTVTTLEDGGKRIVHRQSAIDDGKERLVMELVLTKKAEAKPAK
jgi:Protein of unknown function (DUF1579)